MGALSILGRGEGFESFTIKGPEFFSQVLQALAEELHWTKEKIAQVQQRIDLVKLNPRDGTRARAGNQLAQDRVIRVLQILQEASGFEEPLLSQEAYTAFLKQKIRR